MTVNLKLLRWTWVIIQHLYNKSIEKSWINEIYISYSYVLLSYPPTYLRHINKIHQILWLHNTFIWLSFMMLLTCSTLDRLTSHNQDHLKTTQKQCFSSRQNTR